MTDINSNAASLIVPLSYFRWNFQIEFVNGCEIVYRTNYSAENTNVC